MVMATSQAKKGQEGGGPGVAAFQGATEGSSWRVSAQQAAGTVHLHVTGNVLAE